MRPPGKASNELERQVAVDELLVMDLELKKTVNLITRMVATQLHMPMSAFTIIDRDRLYVTSQYGLEIDEVPRDLSFCGHAILQNDVFSVPDALRHQDFHDSPFVTSAPNIRSYWGVPVHAPNGQTVGALCAVDTQPRTLSPTERGALVLLRDILEAVLELLYTSLHDHMTGLSNRRHFDEVNRREWRRACRSRLPIALLSIDIDFFKSYNDTYGHQAGDECLRKIADTLKNKCKRSGDIPFRVGGEEFAILLTATNGERGAVEFASELQQAIHAVAIPHHWAPSQIVTASIGLTIAESDSLPTDGSGLYEFVLKSDEALYAAKAQGRDRTVLMRFHGGQF